MARALSSIRDDVRQLIGQTDSANSNFTNAVLDRWINEGYRKICVALEVVTITERTYTTADSVTLNAGTISVDIVKFLDNDGTNTQWKELKVIDLETLVKIDPDWENASTGSPDYAVKKGHFTMMMYPPLDANNTSQANGLKTYGNELPTALADDADTTAFAHHLDDIIAHYAAYWAFSRMGDVERSNVEMINFRGMLKESKKMATQWSRGRRQWEWMSSDQSDRRSVEID